MARFVIDAATLLHIAAGRVEANPVHQLVAPNVIRSHALALLFASVRQGELTEKEALEHHERLTETKVRLLGDRVSRRTAWKMARQQGWETTFDAEYFAVTKLQADFFVSVDPAMLAMAATVVPTAPISALIDD